MPGRTTNDTPAGTGVLLHAGAAVVMQVHYNLIHQARPDRSRALLRVVFGFLVQILQITVGGVVVGAGGVDGGEQ